MDKAYSLKDVLKVTGKEPLSGENFDKFYVNTDAARGRRSAEIMALHLKSLADAPQHVLFTGHKGSGKSTELWRLQQLVEDTFLPVAFSVVEHTDPLSMTFIDLVFLLMERVFDMSRQRKLHIPDAMLTDILNWMQETTELRTDEKSSSYEIEAGAGVPEILGALLLRLKGIFKLSSETKVEVRKKIEPRIAQLISRCNDMLHDVNAELARSERRLLIIVEDLDKLGTAVARALFCDNSQILTSLNVHIVYTIPIYLFYSGEFNVICESFDFEEILPMITVHDRAGGPVEKGLQCMTEIISRRIDETVLAPELARKIVALSGGRIRDVFDVIKNGALQGLLDGDSTFSAHAFEEGKKSLKKRYEMALSESDGAKFSRDEILASIISIYGSQTKKMVANPILKDLLHRSAVLEYNDDRWCDVHPVVVEILTGMGMIKPEASDGRTGR